MHYTSLLLLITHRCWNVYYVAYIGKRAQYKQKEGTQQETAPCSHTWSEFIKKMYVHLLCLSKGRVLMDIWLDLCIHLIKSLHKAFVKCPFKEKNLEMWLDKPSAKHIQVERSNLYCQLSQLATAGDSLLVLEATLAACQWELEVKQKYFSTK